MYSRAVNRCPIWQVDASDRKWNELIWHAMIGFDMVGCNMIWYDMMWYDMIWYEMKWYDGITTMMVNLYMEHSDRCCSYVRFESVKVRELQAVGIGVNWISVLGKWTGIHRQLKIRSPPRRFTTNGWFQNKETKKSHSYTPLAGATGHLFVLRPSDFDGVPRRTFRRRVHTFDDALRF